MPSKKLLLIGWDAADWKAITPLMDAGKMPNLQRLVESGVKGNLATLQPALSPMLWTSIATGKRPYKHGVHGFSEPDPTSGGIRPVSNLSRTTKAMWNILNQSGLRSTVVGWWPSHPAEPLTKGVMVSNHYQRSTGDTFDDWKLQPGTVHPPRLNEVLAGLRVHPTDIEPEMIAQFLPAVQEMTQKQLDEFREDPRLKSLMKILADCSSIHSAATALLQNEPWDFAAIYYDAIDHFGHGFMKYHPPRQDWIPEKDFEIWSGVMESGYRYHDLMLGVLMELAGEDTTIVLMSDHGFHPDHLRPRSIPHEPAGPAVEHRQLGILAAMGPGIRKDDLIFGSTVIDVCPTILHHFGLPIGEDMDGRVLTDLWEDPREPLTIPSWDDVAGEDGSHPAEKQMAPVDSKAALDQLVALGYIEKPDEDRLKALDRTTQELEYNLACAYIDGGVYSEALLILTRLYQSRPEEYRFGLKLISCLQGLERIAEMRRVTAEIIERRTAEAREAAEQIRALNLEDPEVQAAERERVEKMSDEEKQEHVRRRRELIAKSSPNLFSLRYIEAFADFNERRYDDALAKLEKLDEDYGARLNALCLRADIYLRKRDWFRARVSCTAALEIDVECAGAHLGLARAALGEKDYQGAVSHAEASVGLVFHQPRAHYVRGLAHYGAGEWREAESAFLTAAQQAPLMTVNYRMLADIAREFKDDMQEATDYFSLIRQARKRLTEEKRRKVSAARPPAGTVARPIRLSPRPHALSGVPESEIVTIVTGLPRSGTSLMMQMLEAGGMLALSDEKRAADESNPRGYYELEGVSRLTGRNADAAWLDEARGQAVKVVAPLLPLLFLRAKRENRLPSMRVIFMERDMEEILDSQRRMLERLDRDVEQETAKLERAYESQVRAAKAWIERAEIPALEMNYAELVADPKYNARKLARFLERPRMVGLMASVVDPRLYRSRASAAAATA